MVELTKEQRAAVVDALNTITSIMPEPWLVTTRQFVDFATKLGVDPAGLLVHDIVGLTSPAEAPPEVDAIVEAFLRANKYDGLVAQGECGCLLSEGLVACGDIMGTCQAGWREDCDDDCKDDHGGWHVTMVRR